MIFHIVYDKAVTGEDFKQCLIELKEATVSAGIENPIYIFDNARIHHYRGLQEAIDQLRLNICYLPPYSPFLNLLENIFSVWKNFILIGWSFAANCAGSASDLRRIWRGILTLALTLALTRTTS